MKKINLFLLTCALTVSSAFAQTKNAPLAFAEHGGGNGGDDIELELKKKSLQIGYFLKSEVGKKVFNIINGDAALEAIERTDIDVVTGNVVDKYGTIRTCVNESERSLITCNLDRLNELKKKGQSDVLTAMLFHEILGIMGVELGYQDNVSMYPISSKIMAYDGIVSSTPVSEANIRPEYFGLDNRGYGLTLVNSSTKETIRMICLNSNVEIHRCRNYSLVRNANGLQAPLVNGIVSLSPAQLAAINLNNVKSSDLRDAESRLNKIQTKGFKFISLRGTVNGGDYRYGTGLSQVIAKDVAVYSTVGAQYVWLSIVGMTEVDTAVEGVKQVINFGVWPIKALVNSLRLIGVSGKVKKLNKKINLAKDVLNLSNQLSLVGKSQKISDKNFNQVIEIINLAVKK